MKKNVRIKYLDYEYNLCVYLQLNEIFGFINFNGASPITIKKNNEKIRTCTNGQKGNLII